MITGEIPPEEQEFLNDKAILEKEIFRLDVIENVLLSDRDASNKLLENIKRDANNADESLKACRKLYFQLGVETQALRAEEAKKGCLDVE
jgi:golgin subfamily B member 1